MRYLFDLVSITVAKGPVTVGIQYEDGTLAVYNDLTTGVWPLEGADRIDRVTLECPSGALCPTSEVLLTMVRVTGLEIEPLITPYTTVGIGGPEGRIVIGTFEDGFEEPPYPDGWCFIGRQAELRFSEVTVRLSVATYGFPLVCTPGRSGGPL